MNEKLVDQLYTLIRSASTDLPADVEGALREAETKEPAGSTAGNTFGNILQNVKMAREAATPICQDTGALVMYVHHPVGTDTVAFRNAVEAAAQRATKDVLLRPNAVDPVTGKNTGDNVGVNAPYISFKQWDKDEIHVKLMLKGFKAQGMGCAPGVIGVGVGGDRATSFLLSKEQFFRKIGSENPDPELDALETDLHQDLNKLGIGPMGFGGETTVLDVYVGTQHRHPATFYVAISYMCWACRRKEMSLENGEARYA